MTSIPPPGVSESLAGQVAMVTGASSGLGRRFATVLASAGAHVIACARRVDRLADLAAALELRGERCTPLEMDVSDAGSIVAGVEWASTEVGPVTILVNNAGMPDAQLANRMQLDLIDKVIATNLRGPFVLSCEVARRLIASDRPGRIVNLASMGAYQYSIAGASLYSITKAGVARMTEVLSVEWARHHINVNAIAPGIFASEMIDGMFERVGDMTDSLPRRRIGDPAQLDSTLLYLVSPASECVTGTIIKVDDGQSGR